MDRLRSILTLALALVMLVCLCACRDDGEDILNTGPKDTGSSDTSQSSGTIAGPADPDEDPEPTDPDESTTATDPSDTYGIYYLRYMRYNAQVFTPEQMDVDPRKVYVELKQDGVAVLADPEGMEEVLWTTEKIWNPEVEDYVVSLRVEDGVLYLYSQGELMIFAKDGVEVGPPEPTGGF